MTPSAAALIAKVGLRRLMARALFAPLRDRGERQRRVHQFTFASDAEAVAYPFARGHGRLPDFAAPTLLPEKVRWTFLHHPNPLMSLVSDKIAVRDYLALRGALIQPPDLIATGHDPEAILTLDLPERFVLKASNSCGANHVHPGPNPPDRGALRDLLVPGVTRITGAGMVNCSTARSRGAFWSRNICPRTVGGWNTRSCVFMANRSSSRPLRSAAPAVFPARFICLTGRRRDLAPAVLASAPSRCRARISSGFCWTRRAAFRQT